MTHVSAPDKWINRFFKHDSAGGILLVIMATLAMLLANSPLASNYQWFLDIPVEVQIGNLEVAKPLLLWINDGLMALFFFLVGLELKREVLHGHLSEKSNLTLPMLAAAAGIAVPALIYYFFNQNDPIGVKGWAIPAATDIAFALGIFSLFGKHLPVSLKLFLLSVAILDDLSAIIIIALFYSADLAVGSLMVAAVGISGLFIANRMKVRSEAVYILLGVVVWVSVLKSGVHATLAGFAVALFIPTQVENNDGHFMAEHMEHGLHKWVTFFILPLFAFANAGVSLAGVTLNGLFDPIVLGIAAGLFVGKQLGVFGICWLAIKANLAPMPKDATWAQLYAVAILCGVGFTMSLFIGSLAFEGLSNDFQVKVKLGVLLGSLLSAVVGALILYKLKSKAPQPDNEAKHA
jgi:NhaA family Na+:H+ antiporter